MTRDIDSLLKQVTSKTNENVTLLGSSIRRNMPYHRATPGELPGIEHIADASKPPEAGSVTISFIDYSVTKCETGDITDIDNYLAKPIPDWVTTRWLNVSLPHPYVINQFRQHFGFHTLTAEDVIHISQRPRVEFFDDHVFVVLRMLKLKERESGNILTESVLDTEQVSLFLYEKVLITFQEQTVDAWKLIRERLLKENARIRKNNTGYLLYVLLDAMVDHCFPVLEEYGDILEELEVITLEKPTPVILHRIHAAKRELSLLRRIVWPMREVIDHLYREEDGRMEVSV